MNMVKDFFVKETCKASRICKKKLLESILNGTYKLGETQLPAERVLCGLIGVIRPALRETLQRLSKEGWLTIQHGKFTQVNDYLTHGGLGLLSSLTRYGRHLTMEMMDHLLDVRTILLPEIARRAAMNYSKHLIECLKASKTLNGSSAAFAPFDWSLQIQMVRATNNPLFHMIFNDDIVPKTLETAKMKLSRLDDTYDLVVAGGGVTGAGVFNRSVRMGSKTLLVEAKDFVWGTSSRSSKMVHGGLRYLKQGKFLLTKSAVQERENLLKEYKGLVTRLSFIIPVFKKIGPSSSSIKLGLSIYNFMAKKTA